MLKYAALNYTSLWRFGSIEFRSMATYPNFERVDTWAKILTNLKKMSTSYDTCAEITDKCTSMEYKDWVKKVLGGFSEEVYEVAGEPEESSLDSCLQYAHACDRFKKRVKPLKARSAGTIEGYNHFVNPDVVAHGLEGYSEPARVGTFEVEETTTEQQVTQEERQRAAKIWMGTRRPTSHARRTYDRYQYSTVFDWVGAATSNGYSEPMRFRL